MRACRAPDLAGQIRRASASIPTNIVEGAGSQSTAQFVRYLGIALASSQETEYLLLLARDTSAISREAHDSLVGANQEVQRMLCGLIAAVRRKSASRPARTRRRPALADPET